MLKKSLVSVIIVSSIFLSLVTAVSAETISFVPTQKQAVEHPLDGDEIRFYLDKASLITNEDKPKFELEVVAVNVSDRLVSDVSNVHLVLTNRDDVKIADLHIDKMYMFLAKPGEEQNTTPAIMPVGGNTVGKYIVQSIIPKDLLNGIHIKSYTYKGQKADEYIVSKGIHLFINNDIEQLFTPAPVIIEGNTLVPMRAIFENLGATLSWDDASRTVTAVKDGITLIHKVGSNQIKVNEKSMEMPASSAIMDGSTMIPLRAVSEALNARVFYGNTDGAISIVIYKY